MAERVVQKKPIAVAVHLRSTSDGQISNEISLKSQIFFTGDLNLQAKCQILNRISHQNLESSNSKSQIPKRQKGFSKHFNFIAY